MKGQRGFSIRLVAARWLSPSVRSLIFQPADGFEYRAGQSVQLTVPTKSGLFMRRPYSMASAPGALEGGRFEIAVTQVENGATSTALHALPVGAELMAEGPHGGWLSLSADERGLRTLLVATGSGLAPLRALVQEQLRSGGRFPSCLLFGCRTTEDILWRDDLYSWGLQPQRLSVEVTLSRPALDWVGRTGYVQGHLDELIRKVDPELVLICGLSCRQRPPGDPDPPDPPVTSDPAGGAGSEYAIADIERWAQVGLCGRSARTGTATPR